MQDKIRSVSTTESFPDSPNCLLALLCFPTDFFEGFSLVLSIFILLSPTVLQECSALPFCIHIQSLSNAAIYSVEWIFRFRLLFRPLQWQWNLSSLLCTLPCGQHYFGSLVFQPVCLTKPQISHLFISIINEWVRWFYWKYFNRLRQHWKWCTAWLYLQEGTWCARPLLAPTPCQRFGGLWIFI